MGERPKVRYCKVTSSIDVGPGCRLRNLASIPVIMVIRVPINTPMLCG